MSTDLDFIKKKQKALKQSFEQYKESDLRKTLDAENEWLAHSTGFRDGIDFALANQWMPFSEGNAPEVNEDVLIRDETGNVSIAKIIETPISDSFSWMRSWQPEVKSKVTHWMRIPKFNK